MYKSLKNLTVSLLNAGHVQLDNHWNYSNVISPFSRLYYIDGGTAQVFHHKQVFQLKSGYLYLIPSFTLSAYKCDEMMSQYYLSFFEELGEGFSVYQHRAFKYEVRANEIDLKNFQRLLELNPNRSYKNDDPKVYDNHKMLMSFEKENEMLTPQAYVETKGIILTLLSRFILESEPTSIKDSSTYKKISDVVNYINQNLHTELTVDLLAGMSHMNTDYFSRAFKHQTGIRPINYIQSKRIERAQLLLVTTPKSIPEIASECGLSNLSYFSRLFKKVTGSSPGEFRKKNLELIV